ncbi:MAG: hypothetical protein NTY77_16375 [Elusimicrobia bacterium]|nr:hypothetical protein [Elusimicrobiota bacterium]
MTLSLILSALVLTAPAWADHGRACREDARKLCPKDSGPRRLHCLEAHKKDLSPACQENLARMRAEGEEFKKDCREDSAKLCSGKEGHELMECLEDSVPRLSTVCAERVRKLQAGRRVTKERIPAACREDAEKLCAQASAAADGVLACIKADPAKLGEGCRKALAQPEPAK